ncbi:MAG TPA: 2-oxo-4-hydroxy-4-carboxy-5-ureidoimidazoline decarboxylase [Gemmatimonadales bacterium]|nr:2-oxo-4-hydroxy-4-carboxy-5-ureidoimidazoline decarboxylase [Gemmatimonadales bacterium]
MGTAGPAEHLNGLSASAARAALTRCCASRRWVDAMLAARPFASDSALFDGAERAWWTLGKPDWLEAFGGHPRIGEPGSDAWARREQAGASSGGGDETRAALAQGNREYESRFGHVFLICATGKSAAEMLSALRGRLSNDPATELRIAAGEQSKIIRLRLEKLAAS